MRSDGTTAVRGRSRVGWAVLAVSLALSGAVGSFWNARSIAHDARDERDRAFRQSSDEVAFTLKLAIQREEDLVVSAGAFVVGGVDGVDNARFAGWLQAVRAFERYPELQWLGQAVPVPSSEVDEFLDAAVAGGVGEARPIEATGVPAIDSGSERPFSCLAALGHVRPDTRPLPVGLDFCAGANGAKVPTSADDSNGRYRPIRFGDRETLLIESPVFSGGTVAVRGHRSGESFEGWIGMMVDPTVVLDTAVRGQEGITVELRFAGDRSGTVFRSGPHEDGARSASIDLDNGWTVTTFGPAFDHSGVGDGEALALLIAGLALSLLIGALVYILGTGRTRAIRLVRTRTEELRHQASHDALTGLPNRAFIVERVEQLIVDNRRGGTSCAVLFLDLDGFKDVNDTLGHDAGDHLLRAVAGRLTSGLRGTDTIGRLGGDEFVVLIDGRTRGTDPEQVAQRLLEIMSAPFELDLSPRPLPIGTSIGIATGDRSTGGELLRDADVALYAAKGAGKNCARVFGADMELAARNRYDLEVDLKSALAAGQFRLAYQPIFELEELTAVGVEALLRWHHPTLGIVEPDRFVPLLEASGQILEVGGWIVSAACRQAMTWRASGWNTGLTVNVSAIQFERGVIVEQVRLALAESGLPPGALTLDISETSLVEGGDVVIAQLSTLRALGVEVAIDDFGTGRSSLANLQRFPVHCLKIDREFVAAIGNADQSAAILRTLVLLGEELGLVTVAEGVETDVQLAALRILGVDRAQGFLLARPGDPSTMSWTELPIRVPPPSPLSPSSSRR